MNTGFKMVLTAFLAVSLVWSADWYQWRGPDRTGISKETGLLKKWPAGGPPLVWSATGLGAGYASVSTSHGRLYTQGQRDNQQYLMAFDAATGKKVWETPNGKEYIDRRGNGPRGSPTVDGDRVYALAANGHLLCVDAASGKKVWDLDLFEKYDAENIHWGVSESPLIDAAKLIITPGGSKAGMVALDKATGKQIWESQPDKAGYSSAVIAEIGGVRQYITLTGTAAVGIRADDGKLLWRYEKVANRTANVATPILRENYVFVSSAYGTGAALLQLSASGQGTAAEEMYFTSQMQNHYSSSVLLGDYLYGYSQSILTCMNFETGEVVWKDRAVGKGQVIYADGLLYLQGEDGVVGLAEPTPEGYREISRFEIGRGEYPVWTLPVIADGKLYLRDQDKLICYDIKAP